MNLTPKKYKTFNTFRSTGYLVPILYLFIEHQMGLKLEQIIQLAGFYMMLPFLLEIPLGYIGDKIGNKKMVQSGLIAQILSCLALLFINNSLGYQLYLSCIYIAGAAYSGADKALIFPHFKEEFEFKKFLIEANGDFYKFGIIFLLIGGLFYKINPQLPIILQIISFIISFYALSSIEDKEHKKIKKITPLSDIKLLSKFFIQNPGYLAISVLSGIFSAAILINHKSIQNIIISHLNDFFKINHSYLMATIYIAGNITAWKTSKIYSSKFSKTWNFSRQLVLLTFVGTVSFIFLSIGSLAFIICGFLLLNIFKALFRPILSGELTSRFPVKNLLASALSIGALVSALIISALHMLTAHFFTSPNIANFYIAIMIFVPGIILTIIATKSSKTLISLGRQQLTGKQNFLAHEAEKIWFIQQYPQDIDEEHFHGLQRIKDLSIYPHAMSKINHKSKQLISRNIYGNTLSQTKDQIKYIKQLFQAYKKTGPLKFNSNTNAVDELLKAELPATIINKLLSSKNWGNIHGDLHPDNILICNDTLYVIDWDLCGEGYLWFDHLTLLTHPLLSIKIQDRISIFRNYFPDFSTLETLKIFTTFRTFKAKQLQALATIDASYAKLSELYLIPLGSLR